MWPGWFVAIISCSEAVVESREMRGYFLLKLIYCRKRCCRFVKNIPFYNVKTLNMDMLFRLPVCVRRCALR